MRKVDLRPKYDASKGGWSVRLPNSRSEPGKRSRKYFKTEDEAQEFSKRLVQEEATCGRLVHKAGSKFVADAMMLDEELKLVYGVEGGLIEVGLEAKRRYDKEHCDARFGAMLDSYERDRSKNWGKSSRDRWKWVSKDIGDLRGRRMELLDSDHWAAWIEETAKKRGWNARSQRDVVTLLSSVWNYAIARGKADRNPFRAVILPKAEKKSKAVYTVEEVERLLCCAWEHDREVVPYFAITIFAGLRPETRKDSSEMTKLRWEDVNFADNPDDCWIRVGAEFDNKNEAKRFVPMSENLMKWLEPWREATGLVVPRNLRRRVEYVKWGKYNSPDGTPRKQWVSLLDERDDYKDISRHTYGSYLDADCRDYLKVMAYMGHTSPKTYQQHYKNSRTPEEGRRFWNVVPQPAETR